MIAMVIIAILSVIALPSYSRYIERSRRSDAWSALSTDQGILERCYAQTFDYRKVLTGSNGCARLSNTAATPTTSAGAYYGVIVVSASTSAYMLQATPLAGSPQANDTQCASISVDSTNTRSALDSSRADQSVACWGH